MEARVRNSYRRWFEANPIKTILAVLVCLFFTLDLAIAKIYKTIKGHAWVNYGPYTEQRCRTYSPIYHHDFRKNVSVDAVPWGPHLYRLRTNSLGFKDKKVREVSLVSNKRRLLFIGDSFTEGVGYEYSKTWVGLLDTALSSKNIEVLNAGVGSYCPTLFSRKLKYLISDVGLKVDEVFAFLDISDPQDETEIYYITQNGTIKNHPYQKDDAYLGPDVIPKPFPADEEAQYQFSLIEMVRFHTIISCWMIDQFTLLSSSEAKPKNGIVRTNRGSWTVDDRLYQRFGEKGLRKMSEAMDDLHAFLQKKNVKLTVAVYPWPDQIMSHDLHSKQVSYWRRWCEQKHVNFLDCFPLFIGENATPSELEQVVHIYYVPGDIHWNEKGHQFMADFLLKKLGL